MAKTERLRDTERTADLAILAAVGVAVLAIGMDLGARQWNTAVAVAIALAVLMGARVFAVRWRALTDAHLRRAAAEADMAEEILAKVRGEGTVQLDVSLSGPNLRAH